MKNNLAIIIPNYNSFEITSILLKALSKQGNFFDIVVVDDCSSDDSYSRLKKIKNITLLKNKKNMGCGSALNTGIDYCLGRGYLYLILTDNDAVPLSKNLIKKLVEKLVEDNRRGFIVPKNKNNVNQQGGEIGGWMFHFFTVSSKLIRKIGKIDSNYFIQIEDLDYSYRIGLAGFKGFQINESYTHPDKPITWISPNFIYYTIRNSLYFNKKFNRGFTRFLEEKKILVKCAAISAFSKINNLNLDAPIDLGISDYRESKMGKNTNQFDKKYFEINKSFSSPKELYLSEYNSNKLKYFLKIILYLLK